MMPLEPPACHQTIATMVDNSPRQWLGLFWWHQRGPNYAFGAKKSLGHRSWFSFNRTLVQSVPCLLLVTPSLSPHCETWLMWPWHVKIHATSLCLTSCCPFWQPCRDIRKSYINLFQLLHGIRSVATQDLFNCYTGFVKSFHIYFSPFSKRDQAEVWPRFQRLLKLLLWELWLYSHHLFRIVGFTMLYAMF